MSRLAILKKLIRNPKKSSVPNDNRDNLVSHATVGLAELERVHDMDIPDRDRNLIVAQIAAMWRASDALAKNQKGLTGAHMLTAVQVMYVAMMPAD